METRLIFAGIVVVGGATLLGGVLACEQHNSDDSLFQNNRYIDNNGYTHNNKHNNNMNKNYGNIAAIADSRTSSNGNGDVDDDGDGDSIDNYNYNNNNKNNNRATEKWKQQRLYGNPMSIYYSVNQQQRPLQHQHRQQQQQQQHEKIEKQQQRRRQLDVDPMDARNDFRLQLSSLNEDAAKGMGLFVEQQQQQYDKRSINNNNNKYDNNKELADDLEILGRLLATSHRSQSNKQREGGQAEYYKDDDDDDDDDDDGIDDDNNNASASDNHDDDDGDGDNIDNDDDIDVEGEEDYAVTTNNNNNNNAEEDEENPEDDDELSSQLPYGIQNVRKRRVRSVMPPTRETIVSNLEEVVYQSLCPTNRVTVTLDSGEYRPNHYVEVTCAHTYSPQQPQRMHSNYDYSYRTGNEVPLLRALYQSERGSGDKREICSATGFSCIQLNRTIHLIRLNDNSGCWESETRTVPSGCECMWPKHSYGDIASYHQTQKRFGSRLPIIATSTMGGGGGGDHIGHTGYRQMTPRNRPPKLPRNRRDNDDDDYAYNSNSNNNNNVIET